MQRRRSAAALWIGGGMLGVVVLAMGCANLWPDPPAAFHLHHLFAPPGGRFPFGTNALGQDLFSQVLYGSRLSIGIAFGASLTLCSLGLLVGTWAGYFGGIWDSLWMRTVDVLLTVPPLLVLALLASQLGASPTTLVLILGGLGWMPFARIVRAQILAWRNTDVAAGLEAMGASPGRIILFHVWPNLARLFAVQATLSLAATVVAEASISYLGFGIQPPHFDWGSILGLQQDQVALAPWIALFPGLALSWTVVSLVLISEGLRRTAHRIRPPNPAHGAP